MRKSEEAWADMSRFRGIVPFIGGRQSKQNYQVIVACDFCKSLILDELIRSKSKATLRIAEEMAKTFRVTCVISML